MVNVAGVVGVGFEYLEQDEGAGAPFGPFCAYGVCVAEKSQARGGPIMTIAHGARF